MNKFSIEDEVHAEWQSDFATFDDALSELEKRAKIPWNEKPNVCPCTGWKTCERLYTITEFIVGDNTFKPQKKEEVLMISSKGAFWLKGFEQYENN